MARSVWHQVQLAGHELKVYEPAQLNQQHWVLLYLHDSPGDAVQLNPELLNTLEQLQIPLVCPQTGHSWWTNRIWPGFSSEYSTEQYLIDQVLPWIEQKWPTDQKIRIGLLGTGMGGQAALRWSFRMPDRFPVVAALLPKIDHQHLFYHEGETLPELYSNPEAVRQDTATLHIHPLYWPRNTWFAADPSNPLWDASAEKLHMKLAALGIPHEYIEPHQHGPDFLTPTIAAAISFLTDRLGREQRRVV